MKTLEFKIGTSRARDTEGYTIVSLYVDGKRVSSCNGGGYDMQGTCFGDWLEKAYKQELLAIADRAHSIRVAEENCKYTDSTRADRLYGMTAYLTGSDLRIGLDGACGFDSMRRIAEAIGLQLRFVFRNARKEVFTIAEETTQQQVSQ